MKLKEIIEVLEALAPPSLQEEYDNSGLLVGNVNDEVSGALISLDCTEAVVQEAVNKGINLIIAHHPIVFSGLKRFNGNSYIERTVMSAIRHGIAIYAIHTNLDNVLHGVNGHFAKQLNLQQCTVLREKTNSMRAISVYVPNEHVHTVRLAMFEAGGGKIGNYDQCSFNAEGTGTFRPNNQAEPFSGQAGVQSEDQEVKIEMVCPTHLVQKVIRAMKAAHPYEEVAYHVLAMENGLRSVGSGIIGYLPEPMEEKDFLGTLKAKFESPVIKHTALLGRKIQKVALCGGSGVFLLRDAIRAGADVFVTADVKYHQFFDADNQLVLADIGHFESEYKTGEIIAAELKHYFTTFAVHFSTVNTNPVNYY